ncbi:MAG: L-fucose:H+ symporter permease [Chitinophagaceae bacterium]|nr:L-fucose:H+ symporter permease [Chitinophagaceae bacterium]
MKQKNNFIIPLVLVTSLFFLWGLAYGLLDVLNKHFQETLNITRQRSTLLQAAYFGAYFLVALPAGIFMNRVGYKKGIITGLLLYATGALLFYPSASLASFPFFLFSLFVLACGLTFLETAANPYITVLGKPETSEFRLNLSQSFNGVGSFIGPIIGGALFFGNQEGTGTDNLGSVKLVYIAIAAMVLLVALLFLRTPMPEVREEEPLDQRHSGQGIHLSRQPHFTGAVIAQFFYVAAQVGIAALFINYCTEQDVGIDNEKASYLLSASLFIFTMGRFAGTAIMKTVAPHRLLAIYAMVNIALCVIVVFHKGMLSVYALMAIFFFESIMFPTIFAMGVKQLGTQTKRASSFIIMAIVGGAIMPYVMGWVADRYSTATSYFIPLCCFMVVVWYGWKGYRVRSTET